MSELEPCKFCGSVKKEPHLLPSFYHPDETDYLWAVRCGWCLCSTYTYMSKENAIAAWNRKPEPEPITPEGLERLGFKSRSHDRSVYEKTIEGSGKRVLVQIFSDSIDFEATGYCMDNPIFLNPTKLSHIVSLLEVLS